MTVPHAAAAVAIILLFAACVSDFRQFIIPNWIPVALLASISAAWALGAPVNPASAAVSFALVTVTFGLLWHFGLFAGGDWKLLSAAAAWSGLEFLPDLLLGTAIAGGVLSAFMLALRMVPAGSRLRRVGWLAPQVSGEHVRMRHVPYGLAIAAGAILAILDGPMVTPG